MRRFLSHDFFFFFTEKEVLEVNELKQAVIQPTNALLHQWTEYIQKMVLHYNMPECILWGEQPKYLHTLLRCLDTPKCVTHLVYFLFDNSVLILPKQRRMLSIHTNVELFHLKFTSRQYCTWKPKTCCFTL